MPLKSMTGYGRGEAAGRGIKVTVELSAVNRKQLDIHINLPRPLVVLESRILELVQKSISRGSLSGSVTVAAAESMRAKGVRIDAVMAGAYIRTLRQAAAQLGLKDDMSVSMVLRLPEVVQYEYPGAEIERVWPVLAQAVRRALADLQRMRQSEGQTLSQDLARRLDKLTGWHAGISKVAPSVTRRYRAGLLQRIKKAGIPVGADNGLLARELVLFAEKADISEELVRLGSHLQQLAKHSTHTGPVGRRMDFLVQEMFREINTIGSKANDIRITRQVIEFKAELERIREQIQNIE